jgi:hypothetical protein
MAVNRKSDLAPRRSRLKNPVKKISPCLFPHSGTFKATTSDKEAKRFPIAIVASKNRVYDTHVMARAMTNRKQQTATLGATPGTFIGNWSLGFPWTLVIGHWSLDIGHSVSPQPHNTAHAHSFCAPMCSCVHLCAPLCAKMKFSENGAQTAHNCTCAYLHLLAPTCTKRIARNTS